MIPKSFFEIESCVCMFNSISNFKSLSLFQKFVGLIFQDDISKFLPEGFKLEDTTSSTTESSTSLLADILFSIEKKEKAPGGSSTTGSGSSTGSRLGGFRPHSGPALRPFKSKSSDQDNGATTEATKSQSVNPLSGVRN